jgi:peptide/nickel transport system substrate-binding protein
MPDSVKELFTYHPEKAKQLLAEAGYPHGFSFKVTVCSCNPDHMNVLPLVAAYLKQVGVNVEIKTMQFPAFLSAITSRSMSTNYFMNAPHANPLTSLRDSFTTSQQRNLSGWSDPVFDQRMDDAYEEPDEAKRQAIVHELTREILNKAPYLWLPTPYAYTAWWPWVRNYGGELASSAVRPGAIYARIWVDQEMKKAMGF